MQTFVCCRYEANGDWQREKISDVWSAAELQAKNEGWQLVGANVFGL
jgi:hypothetical protein